MPILSQTILSKNCNLGSIGLQENTKYMHVYVPFCSLKNECDEAVKNRGLLNALLNLLFPEFYSELGDDVYTIGQLTFELKIEYICSVGIMNGTRVIERKIEPNKMDQK